MYGGSGRWGHYNTLQSGTNFGPTRFIQELLEHIMPDLNIKVLKPVVPKRQMLHLPWQGAYLDHFGPRNTAQYLLSAIEWDNPIQFTVYYHDWEIPRQLSVKSGEIEPVELNGIIECELVFFREGITARACITVITLAMF